jgi:hypothetical protein
MVMPNDHGDDENDVLGTIFRVRHLGLTGREGQLLLTATNGLLWDPRVLNVAEYLSTEISYRSAGSMEDQK